VRGVSRITLLLFALFVPALAQAREPASARYVYPNASVFAWPQAQCPNGSAPISDSVYMEAGRLNGVTYCIFPVPEIAIAPGSYCPAGFTRLSGDRCLDQRVKP
jgi:hypothetical protein